MAGISLNQMYKQSGAADSGVSYKDWIASEENLYKTKIDNGKIKGQMPFNFWMQARWQGKLNATGIGANLADIGKDVLAKVAGKSGTGAVTPKVTETPYVAPDKRILGMKPVVFWTVTAVGTIAAIYITVKVVQKIRKS